MSCPCVGLEQGPGPVLLCCLSDKLADAACLTQRRARTASICLEMRQDSQLMSPGHRFCWSSCMPALASGLAVHDPKLWAAQANNLTRLDGMPDKDDIPKRSCDRGLATTEHIADSWSTPPPCKRCSRITIVRTASQILNCLLRP